MMNEYHDHEHHHYDDYVMVNLGMLRRIYYEARFLSPLMEAWLLELRNRPDELIVGVHLMKEDS